MLLRILVLTALALTACSKPKGRSSFVSTTDPSDPASDESETSPSPPTSAAPAESEPTSAGAAASAGGVRGSSTLPPSGGGLAGLPVAAGGALPPGSAPRAGSTPSPGADPRGAGTLSYDALSPTAGRVHVALTNVTCTRGPLAANSRVKATSKVIVQGAGTAPSGARSYAFMQLPFDGDKLASRPYAMPDFAYPWNAWFWLREGLTCEGSAPHSGDEVPTCKLRVETFTEDHVKGTLDCQSLPEHAIAHAMAALGEPTSALVSVTASFDCPVTRSP